MLDECPNCGCDGVRPSDPLHKVTWQRLDGRCRRCGTHPAEWESKRAVSVFTLALRTRESLLSYLKDHAMEFREFPPEDPTNGVQFVGADGEHWVATYTPAGKFKLLVWA